jgi:hypothetical protein
MNNLIGISTECFYYWVPQKKWIDEQLSILDIFKKYVSRVELHFSVDDILGFDDTYFDLYLEKTKGLSCSFHLPLIFPEIKHLDKVLDKIEEIIKKLNIEYAVWHCDDFASVEMKVGKLSPKFKFGLENSDVRKFGFQHLKDISILGAYPIILDIDHIDEVQKNSLDDEIKQLKNSILGIHFSTPSSDFFKNIDSIKTTHFPFSRSNNLPPKILPEGVPIIIEAVFPELEYRLIEEEILLIKNTYFN